MNGDYADAWPWREPTTHDRPHQAYGRPTLVPRPRSRAFIASREAIVWGASMRQAPPVGYVDEGPDQPYRRSIPAGPIPYHLNYDQVKGDVVALFQAVTPYATVPIVAPRGFWGETFPVQQPFVSYPHPAGVMDDQPLNEPEV